MSDLAGRVLLRAPVPGPQDYLLADRSYYKRGRRFDAQGVPRDTDEDILHVREHHVDELLALGAARLDAAAPGAAPAAVEGTEAGGNGAARARRTP